MPGRASVMDEAENGESVAFGSVGDGVVCRYLVAVVNIVAYCCMIR